MPENGADRAAPRRSTGHGGSGFVLLAHDKGTRRSFEPFLICIDDSSEVFPRFEHVGLEFVC